jgi:hypothetical protein
LIFDQPYLFCDNEDQGEKIKALCVFIGAALRMLKVESDINRILPAGGAPNAIPETSGWIGCDDPSKMGTLGQ